jgi:replicative DNA helicase
MCGFSVVWQYEKGKRSIMKRLWNAIRYSMWAFSAAWRYEDAFRPEAAREVREILDKAEAKIHAIRYSMRDFSAAWRHEDAFGSEDAFRPEAMREAREILDKAEAKIFEIAEKGTRSNEGFDHFKPLIADTIKRLDELCDQENPAEITGIPTGFIDIDRMTLGLQPGDLIIVGGRPSMGKTAFALNIAEHVAVRAKKAVGIFSMELGSAQLARRMLASYCRLDSQKLRTGRLSDDDWARMTVSLDALYQAPLYIDETDALNPIELCARARRLHQQCHGTLGLIIIDYIQLMSSTRQNENRATEISEISRSIKALAKELQVPIIALSQLSRKVEERNDKRPLISDLRDSDAIEQDADVIMMLYRDEYYKMEESQHKGLAGLAEVIICKQKDGPTGSVMLTFLPEYARFENFAQFELRFEESA